MQHKIENLKTAQEMLSRAVVKNQPAQQAYWTVSVIFWSLAILQNDEMLKPHQREAVATLMDYYCSETHGLEPQAMREATIAK